ncbi:MAG: hypothetical protein PPHEINF_5500 [uncultured Paraburkholderia sp.]|nr:MAG: hypothetical protein PPHEINF_5500 [uncultured Paraburkholderia sp.]CAH2805602.1 MAG: hypothetical protein PPHEESC_5565 [uncultured Paraburkholderia sp.]CAH2940800.1 MAG: hypothetical protein PPHEMADMSA_5514 [uncultured Paraburkholderia sp.]CAH2942563.1 MAG: hypothetical protein PPHERAN_5583 [uncultured Paraburkholderia sp.]
MNDQIKETAMPIVDFELSFDRVYFESDQHVRERMAGNCDSDFIRLAAEAK